MNGGSGSVRHAAAVVFDMDGVVTDTASVHEAAWRDLFDDYLERRCPGQQPFGADDYHRFVDGRIRVEGVDAFLGSRGIVLPLGDEDDPPGEGSAWALANRKNELFLARLDTSGVTAFASTLSFICDLRALDRPVALVTASRNADRILAAAGAADLFDARVDGTLAESLHLVGKPDPATFLEAARLVGAAPERSVVVEDALAGVEAGRRGGFGLVVGVDRAGQRQALCEAGADVVVADLGDLSLDQPLARGPR